MATERQIAANRINGAKSRGPITAAGRRKSSLNSVRHGLLAQTIVLPGECPKRFKALLCSLCDEFRPQTESELSLVELMAVARWRQLRLWTFENAGLTHEIQKQQNLEDDPRVRGAVAFRNLSDHSRSLELLNRYESCYDRQYNRALNNLLKRRSGTNPNNSCVI